MRQFHSYGPVDSRYHFCVERSELVEECIQQLIGIPEEGGHYFTIWAPRQTGKTWLVRQVQLEIPKHHLEKFEILSFSLGTLREMEWNPNADPTMDFLPGAFWRLLQRNLPQNPTLKNWDDFQQVFSRKGGLWDRPLLLFLDEVDSVDPKFLALLANQFRELSLSRPQNWLHGLALVGIRAVLGIESQRGSPFNVQKSLKILNFTREEVLELFQQYQDESTQPIESEVIQQLAHLTQGPQYRDFLTQLFSQSNIPFSFHDPIKNFLYLHGILNFKTYFEEERIKKKEKVEREEKMEKVESEGEERIEREVCCFSSPLVQKCLYDALSEDWVDSKLPLLALPLFDDLNDVFQNPLNLQALLHRYQDYLSRLREKGINPWKHQPRRETDFRLTEAVGHFHLYAWLQAAIGKRCVISPEFPTGNGKVDLHIRWKDQVGIIEVKSFVDTYEMGKAYQQAANYAMQLSLREVTIALFLPVHEEEVLKKLSQTKTIEKVQVSLVAISWE